ncbi:Nitrile-specifier protein 5 [Camellia lanceoleosa]|uniref:Nitrile-specifier protein 5 n=1 Tax=Camellia lanceoleosa TaxID=1840588 RepID=A0ACC0H3W8_9ERIC|nr:Nitrile-specifier protein 5 [Camellia lanceoleosa]
MASAQGKWVKLEQKGSGPGARSSHAITIVGQKAYVFGGEFTPRVPVDNHMHVLDLNDLTWSVAEVTGDAPPPRVGVTMASIGETIYVFVGPSGDKWRKTNTHSVFSAVGIGKYIFISGGEVDPSDLGHLGAGQFSGDLYALDTETLVWQKWDDSSNSGDNHPGPRGWCAYAPGKRDEQPGLLVYGGNSPSNDRLGDIFFFTPSSLLA